MHIICPNPNCGHRGEATKRARGSMAAGCHGGYKLTRIARGG